MGAHGWLSLALTPGDAQNSLYLSPFILLLVGFLLGIFVGRRTRNFSIERSPDVGAAPSAGTRSPLLIKKVVRKMEINCQCGASLKFAEGENLPSGYQPMPTGDVYTCPQCGRAIDLKKIHSLEKDLSS